MLGASVGQLVKYAGSTGLVHSRNEFMPEVVMLLEQRAKREDFAGAGVLVAVVRKPSGGYLVQVTSQYQLGGQQHVAERLNAPDLKTAVMWAYRSMRKQFPLVVSRKFAVDLVGAAL